ncbi:hypothetical protein A1O3_05197 [Capronia epimyces CBS 606.96]|uniref:Uncharacterized protein n=1 Tax=Capronia epimyces CBS 606.96 TaxID=1182542 RepID=W9XWC7_9EURO|nr:uncharacterized protein A1O3_05197 [Capronia epimyces CBS 606.96]EXJ84528.1 hypothetical protein A1O3_05197 [Capronia epimyces CBS 606.96]
MSHTPPPGLPSPKGNIPKPSTLRQDSVELYAEILLSRAHSAFFMSATDYREARQDSFHQGKAALEEAERLCMSGEQTAKKRLIAKCWYVRGFLADVCGDNEHAAKHFQQAVELDESYKRLERVQLHLQCLEDAEQVGDMRDSASFLGGWESPSSTQCSSKHTLSTVDSRESVLWGQLMRDVSQARSKLQPQDVSTPSSPSTISRPITSTPVGSPRSVSSGRLDMDAIIEKLQNAPAHSRKASVGAKATQEPEGPLPTKALFSSGNPLITKPPRDPVKNRDENARLAALVEGAKTNRLEREHALQKANTDSLEREHAIQLALATLTGRRPSGEETLLSDTPSVSELDTTAGAPQHIVRPLRLPLDTRINRRLSTSYTVSPTSPSPLRDAFVPDDTDQP